MASLYGYEIESDLPLRRLNAARGRRGLVRVERTEDLDGLVGTLTTYLETSAGLPALAVAETGDGCLLSVAGAGAFHVSPGQMRIAVAPRGAPDEVEQQLGGSAMITLLALRGDLVIHAAAVAIRGGAVLLCGPGGRGKSTLAHALGRLGAPVLSEDTAVVEMSASGPIVFPGPRGLRLRRHVDGAEMLSLVADPVSREPDPCPVRAIALLEDRGSALRVEPLDAADALLEATPSLGHTGGTASMGRAFGLLGSLLRRVPPFRLSLPDRLDALPAVARSLLDHPWEAHPSRAGAVTRR